MSRPTDPLAREVNPRVRGLFIKNLADFQTELARLQAGFLPGITDWQLRQTLPGIIFRQFRRVQDLRQRGRELGLSWPAKHVASWSAGRTLLDRLCHAPDHDAFVRTALQAVPSALAAAIDGYLRENATIYDQPSQPLLETDRDELRALAEQASAWRAAEPSPESEAFGVEVDALLEDLVVVLSTHAGRTGEVCRGGRRIGRLPLPDAEIPAGFTLLEFGPEAPADDADYTERSRYIAVNFLQEVQAADSCAALLFDAPDMPWEFFFDASRHMWDECRHALFGARKLAELGVSVEASGLSTKAYAMRQTLTPLDRYAALTTQEADAFPGKHAGLKEAVAEKDATSAMAWSYDIADETQHVRYSTKWIPVMIEETGEPRSYDQVQVDLRNWRATVLAEAYRPAARASARAS
ncbi:hypothetical protein [Actomonas aquatica]|uniref:Uncharacterized protein n=1 Tax=Actomonas aquatica TaxID=2866162 RepID=A0ABZ1C4T3_9BACT|nr:hypothetical protein [Opitutus sp. WL0086]WRQ85509.1 hypothetical protein K1X11_011920 [Opitutus sp. WL0086]